MSSKEVPFEMGVGAFTSNSSNDSAEYSCCEETPKDSPSAPNDKNDETDGRRTHCGGGAGEPANNYAANKNVAEGLMDIALLSANANQLRFLITYNRDASTYYISLGLIALSLCLQVVVGIALIFRRRIKRHSSKRYIRTSEFLIGGVFMVTVVNILLAAFTTTDQSS